MPLYDEDGGVIPGSEKMDATQFKTMITEHTKLKNKDMNFDKLRKAKLSDLSEEERAQLTDKEKEIVKQRDEVNEKMEEIKKNQREARNELQKKAFDKLCGDNKDLRKKVGLEFDQSLKNVKASSQEELEAKVTKAYTLATGAKPTVDATGAEFSSDGAEGVKESKETAKNTEDADFDKQMGIKTEAEMKTLTGNDQETK